MAYSWVIRTYWLIILFSLLVRLESPKEKVLKAINLNQILPSECEIPCDLGLDFPSTLLSSLLFQPGSPLTSPHSGVFHPWAFAHLFLPHGPCFLRNFLKAAWLTRSPSLGHWLQLGFLREGSRHRHHQSTYPKSPASARAVRAMWSSKRSWEHRHDEGINADSVRVG